MRVGIIGLGAFGQLAARHLKGRLEVVAWDVDAGKRKRASAMGIKFVPLSEAAGSGVVLLCVPISAMESVLKQIRGMVRPGALVLDACSVKVLPCKLMRALLPKSVEAIGTHPLFGPKSAANGLVGREIVLCPVRASRKTLAAVKRFLESIGLHATVMTPAAHDKAMARTQAIAHLIARALERTGFLRERTGLASVRKMQQAAEIVGHDSPRLFDDLQKLNPFARADRKKFLKAIISTERELG